MAKKSGELTVAEAGRKGGESTSRSHGHEFYQEIGRKGGEKGGPKVAELIRKGKEAEKKKR